MIIPDDVLDWTTWMLGQSGTNEWKINEIFKHHPLPWHQSHESNPVRPIVMRDSKGQVIDPAILALTLKVFCWAYEADEMRFGQEIMWRTNQ